MAVSQLALSFKVPNLSRLGRRFLPAVNVQGIEWRIRMCKEARNGTEFLWAYLYCQSQDNAPDWSCAAQYSIKLVSSKGYDVQKDASVSIYDSQNTNWGILVIKWNSLFDGNNGYVENDTINLGISIEGSYPNDPERSRLIFTNTYKSCEENCCAIFQIRIEQVDNLMAVKTPQLNKTYLPWTLTVFKDRSNELCVRLNSNCKKTTTTVQVMLQSTNPEVEMKTKYMTVISQSEKLVSWTELLKSENGFIKNNSITINVTSTIDGINVDSKDLIGEPLTKRKRLECGICFQCLEGNDISSVACGHVFCTGCIKQYVVENGLCPSCQNPAWKNDLRRVYLPISDVYKDQDV